MNYRHSFHAGNFADLVKHALVLWLVTETQPSVVLDTHAGAGLYDLSGDAARSKEAEAGVTQLMRAEGRPALMQALADRVAAINPGGGVRYYPGSPLLIADALAPGGRYVGFELNPPVRQMLDEALAGRTNAEAREGDGYDLAVAEARLRPLTNPMKMNGCAMVVVNPPAGAEAVAAEICGWVAGALGEAGGRAEVWTF